MSDPKRPGDGRLVPTGRRDLAPVAPANPLVSRGLAACARGGILDANDAGRLNLKNDVMHYLRGAERYKQSDYEMANEDLDAAVRLFGDIIQLHPNNAFAYRHRGKAWWTKADTDEGEDNERSGKEDYDKAMTDFDEAIRLEPNNALSYIERGEAWFWAFVFGSAEKAFEDFDEAIRIDPDNAAWYSLRGLASLVKREYDKAIEDLCGAVRLNSNN